MFVRKVRDNGEGFYALKDDAPAWLRDAVMDAHDGELPNDWRYETCAHIWASFDADHYAYDEDAYAEIADGLVDVYTVDLLGWLSRHLDRLGYVEEAAESFGRGDSLVDEIRQGQYLCIERMVSAIADAIVVAYGEYVEACEAESLDAHNLHMWVVHGCPAGPLG